MLSELVFWIIIGIIAVLAGTMVLSFVGFLIIRHVLNHSHKD